jgi:hypothetical protein
VRKSIFTAASPLVGAIVSLQGPFSSKKHGWATRRSAATIGAALIAAAIVSLLSVFSPEVQARAPQDAIVEIVAVKGDRLDLQRLGTDCSEREWPYFEAACLRDAGKRTASVRQPRIISVDRPLDPMPTR